jgi:hypothetical protein
LKILNDLILGLELDILKAKNVREFKVIFSMPVSLGMKLNFFPENSGLPNDSCYSGILSILSLKSCHKAYVKGSFKTPPYRKEKELIQGMYAKRNLHF